MPESFEKGSLIKVSDCFMPEPPTKKKLNAFQIVSCQSLFKKNTSELVLIVSCQILSKHPMALKYLGAIFFQQRACLSNKSQVYECKVHLKELSNWPIPKPSQTWFPSSVADHPSLFFALHLGYLFFEFNHLFIFWFLFSFKKLWDVD